MAKVASDDESSEGYSDKPLQTLLDAGFEDAQAQALVEAMRQCCEEESEGGPAPPPGKSSGKGKGIDLALVFAGGPKRKGK